MAGSEALYRFLTGKLKEREVPVESLPKVLGISRSTLYRNMKGTAHMLPHVQAKFADIMGLDDDGRAEFERLLGLATFDATMVQARDIVDRFVFPGQYRAPEARSAPLRFALYDQDVFLRTADEIYAQIRELAAAPGASTLVRIIDCTAERWFGSVAAFVEDLLANIGDVTVEHLLTLSHTDYAATASTFTRIVPLLGFDRYSVCYGEQPVGDTTHILGHVVGIEIDRPGEPTTGFMLSFVDDDLCTALKTADRAVLGFFHANFDAAKRGYGEALVDTGIDAFNGTLADLEENTDVYIVKQDFCFERVPMSVYQAVMTRAGVTDLAMAQQLWAGLGGDPATSVETVLSTLDRRARASDTHRHIDVCSVAGLTQFARTGRLTDHLDFIPSFNEAERAAILRHALVRNNDKTDPYTLYITRDALLPDGHIAMVLEDVGVVLEYNPDDYQRGLLSNLFIDNKTLAEIFSDYVRNHFPEAHAMSQDDTNAFLTSLIDELTSSTE